MDNRLPLLLEAAEKAIVAIGDVGVLMKYQNNPNDAEAFKYIALRATDEDGNNVDKLCKEAFELLQQALFPFHDVEK